MDGCHLSTCSFLEGLYSLSGNASGRQLVVAFLVSFIPFIGNDKEVWELECTRVCSSGS